MEWFIENKEWLLSGIAVAIPIALLGWLFSRRHANLVQMQKAGNTSTNLQNIRTREINITHGISYSEAKEIALDVFKENFYALASDAKDIARSRAEEITEKFLTKLEKENQHGVGQAKDPDFQYSLFTIQKEYARTGDKELGDLLVDILVDRTKEEARSILQIVLNEALTVAPKLTADQIAVLSTVFLFRYTINQGINDLETLHQYLDRYVLPFIPSLTKKASCYQHLEFAGCGSISIASRDLGDILRKNYPGVFSNGFDASMLQERSIQ